MLIDTEETYVVLAVHYFGPVANNIKGCGTKEECEVICNRLMLSSDDYSMISMLTLQEYLDGDY